jgi:Na+/melibiose symporter-like transporter
MKVQTTEAGATAEQEVDYDAILKRREKYQHLSKKTNKLDFFIRHSYCAPQLATLPVITLLSVYLNAYYESIGASLAYISFFIALARSLDVMSDPLISYWTDSFRGSYGRRRPFCFAGCWPYAVALMMLLSPPPSFHQLGVSLWFGFCYVSFFLINAFVAIPYDALGPELTDNYEDRSRLFFTAGLYDGLGVLIAVIMPTLVAYVLNLRGDSCTGYGSCYNADGYGKSCMPDPATGDRSIFYLFNSSQTWVTETINNINYTSPEALFQYKICSGSFATNEYVSSYCSCVNECTSLCTVENSRTAYRIVGFTYGFWMILSMSNMVYFVRERSQLNEGHEFEEAPPLVASIFNTMRNRAFMSLLPAWACDAVAQAVLSTMMTFFVQYVIAPEYMTKEKNGIDCNNGVPVDGEESDSWKCKSTVVLGAIISLMLVTALLAVPVWLWLCKKFGKRQTWLAWSLSMALAILLFLAVGEGDVNLAVGLAVIAGPTLGAYAGPTDLGCCVLSCVSIAQVPSS